MKSARQAGPPRSRSQAEDHQDANLFHYSKFSSGGDNLLTLQPDCGTESRGHESSGSGVTPFTGPVSRLQILLL